MRQLCLLLCLSLLILAACRPSNDQAAAAIPTAAPRSPLASDLDAASDIAVRFLGAWQQGDYDKMHDMLTFRNRELTTYTEFETLYENARGTMALENLEYQPKSLNGEGRVLNFQYDMTFKSRILGRFGDQDRQLQLVIDPQADDWRVAWSPGDIFAEMSQGARLVFEEQVPSRANIYDRNGVVLADQNGRVVRVLVDNRRIPEREICFHALSEATGRSVEHFSDLFDIRSRPDWIVDAGTIEAADFIKSGDRLKTDCGAVFRQRSTRRYPKGDLLSHVTWSCRLPRC